MWRYPLTWHSAGVSLTSTRSHSVYLDGMSKEFYNVITQSLTQAFTDEAQRQASQHPQLLKEISQHVFLCQQRSVEQLELCTIILKIQARMSYSNSSHPNFDICESQFVTSGGDYTLVTNSIPHEVLFRTTFRRVEGPFPTHICTNNSSGPFHNNLLWRL